MSRRRNYCVHTVSTISKLYNGAEPLGKEEDKLTQIAQSERRKCISN